MFTDERLWTSENNKYLISDFVNSPDEGDGNFIDKLEEQLKRSPASVKKLAAEMLYILLLCPSNIGPLKKREVVETIWNWSGDGLDMSASIFTDAALQGAGSAGTAFNTGRWREFNYIINFFDKWSAVNKSDQTNLLNDKWKFSKWLEIIPENETRQFRHMILYMLYPDSFERIFSYGDRIKIVSTYTGSRAKDIRKEYSAFDMDKKLLDIRNNLILKNNGDEKVDFYIKPWDGWRSDVDVGPEGSFFPENISRENVLQAIEKIDSQGIPRNASSTTYDLIYEGKSYPPKYVVSLANYFANGFVLERDSFDGGLGTKCFQLLEDLGFEIVEKMRNSEMTFYPQLMNFVEQSKTNNLVVRNYQRTYSDLKVKISFGMGALAKVPWVSFLGKNQTTSNGIYPVYLLFKGHRKLILTKGISVYNRSKMAWAEPTGETINSYFRRELNEIPDSYGGSYVYKVYDIDNLPSQNEMDADLDGLIQQYKELFISDNQFKITESFASAPDFASSAGLHFNADLISRFQALLLTKPFLILTGLSGSGKTKMAQAFSAWLCEDSSQYLIVPVGSDWTNREPLIGYPNSLNPSQYVTPDSGVVDLLMQATENPALPYFLILDEMNLSHVERYFSDFLSLMESGEELKLHSSNEIKDVPKSLAMPRNIFIIGTVNIDETTYMFSPKVLDRAGVIEFRVNSVDMDLFLKNPVRPDLDEIAGLGSSMASDFVRIATESSPRYEMQDDLNNELLIFFDQLKSIGAEFGYRTAFEINRFAGIISALTNGDYGHEKIVDAAIIQKLLPKLHGSRNQLVPVLEKLAELCLKDDAIANVKGKLKSEIASSGDPDVKYPLSFEKIHRMHSRAIKDGFTSFAEA
jgi:5-methylcytosine-specific restriction protein B